MVDPVDVLFFLDLELVHAIDDVLLQGANPGQHPAFLFLVFPVDALDLPPVLFFDLHHCFAIVFLGLADPCLLVLLPDLALQLFFESFSQLVHYFAGLAHYYLYFLFNC